MYGIIKKCVLITQQYLLLFGGSVFIDLYTYVDNLTILLTLCYLCCIEYRYNVRAQAHIEQKEIIKNSSRHCVCRALNIPRDILNVNTFNNILN